MTSPVLTAEGALGRLYHGLAFASEDPSLELLSRDDSNPFLVGLALAGEVEGRQELRGQFEELWDDLDAGPTEERFLEMRVEHCRLFQGPPSPAVFPYESGYVAGEGPGGAARTVEKLYRSAGAAIRPESRDRPDHLSAELEFLSALLEAREGDGEPTLPLSPEEARKTHASFLREHASLWLPKVSRQIEERAELALYRIFGRALSAALRWDLELTFERPDDQPISRIGGDG